MKDSIENFVRTNRAAFDDLEPSPVVWEKIEKQAASQQPSMPWRSIMWRAAAVLLIFSSSFVVNELWHQHRNGPITAQHTTTPFVEIAIPELLEAEVYYTTKVAERIEEFEVYGKNNPELQNELTTELKELDDAFAELKNDLKDDMANEEILEAMIQNYRIKLKMLEEIISHLKESDNDQTDAKAEKDEYIEYEL
jgi:hypothetical protein